MDSRFILLIVIVGAAGLAFVNWYLNRGVEMTGRATIVNHRVGTTRYSTPSYGGSTGWNYYVTFRLSDGEEIELSVFEQQFSQLKKGKSGILHWQGADLLDFQEDIFDNV